MRHTGGLGGQKTSPSVRHGLMALIGVAPHLILTVKTSKSGYCKGSDDFISAETFPGRQRRCNKVRFPSYSVHLYQTDVSLTGSEFPIMFPYCELLPRFSLFKIV